MDRFELYNTLIETSKKDECDILFNESLIKYELTLNDLIDLTINNKFKQIITFCDYWILNENEMNDFKKLIVFEIIFGDKKELIEYIPKIILEQLEYNNECIQNRKCKCEMVDIYGGECYIKGNGHLYCLKYLFEVQHKDCTTYAINWASHYGHFDIIKYLVEIQHKTITNHTIDNAKNNETKQYLKEKMNLN